MFQTGKTEMERAAFSRYPFAATDCLGRAEKAALAISKPPHHSDDDHRDQYEQPYSNHRKCVARHGRLFALAAAKARGVKLGGRPESLKNTELGRQRGAEARRARATARAKDLAPVIEGIRAEGITSDTGIAKALNQRGIPTARGGKWQAVQVQRLERARR